MKLLKKGIDLNLISEVTEISIDELKKMTN